MANAWAMRPLVPLSLVATDTAAGFSPANMLNDHAGVVWKSPPGYSSLSITIDLGSAQTIDAAMFFGCTGASTAWTLVVDAANSADFSSAYWGDPVTGQFLAGSDMPSHGRGVGMWTASASMSRRYWRFTLTNLTGAVVTIARLAMGARLTLERNFAFGAAFGVRDLGRADFSSAGVLLRRRAAKMRTVGITFPAAKKDEVEQKIQPLIELAAGQEAIVLVTDPAAHAQRQKRCYFGLLVGDLGTIWPVPHRWEWRVNLVDLIPIPKAA